MPRCGIELTFTVNVRPTAELIMIPTFTPFIGRQLIHCWCGALLALLFTVRNASGQPFTVQGPGVNTNDFRVTTFASGLNFPLGMARLADDSLLVTISTGSSFFNSTGKLVRFSDTNLDGIADGAGTDLYNNLPGTLTAVRVVDSLVFALGRPYPITVLRAGATPSDPLTLVGQIIINYQGSRMHATSALQVRKTPGYTNRYDLVFQLGAESNFAATTSTLTLTNSNIPGAQGVLAGDALHMLTLIDNGTTVTATNFIQIGSGLRNAAGQAFHPVSGDLYFQDNGIDGLVDAAEPLSADELNFIERTNIGGPAELFGFPSNYTSYRTNAMIGGGGIQPLIAFQPIPDPVTGNESEGPNDITFAPPGFPTGLNTGIFLGFHGQYGSGGLNNEENPVVYANPVTGEYFHFIAGQQPGIGHLDGLLATRDSLFIADLSTHGNIFNGAASGAIYQIKSLVTPPPPVLNAKMVGEQIELMWDRGELQEADEVTGPWNKVTDAFSPQLISSTLPQKFFRVAY